MRQTATHTEYTSSLCAPVQLHIPASHTNYQHNSRHKVGKWHIWTRSSAVAETMWCLVSLNIMLSVQVPI